jgi:hypothetical protein
MRDDCTVKGTFTVSGTFTVIGTFHVFTHTVLTPDHELIANVCKNPHPTLKHWVRIQPAYLDSALAGIGLLPRLKKCKGPLVAYDQCSLRVMIRALIRITIKVTLFRPLQTPTGPYRPL